MSAKIEFEYKWADDKCIYDSSHTRTHIEMFNAQRPRQQLQQTTQIEQTKQKRATKKVIFKIEQTAKKIDLTHSYAPLLIQINLPHSIYSAFSHEKSIALAKMFHFLNIFIYRFHFHPTLPKLHEVTDRIYLIS